MSEVKPRLRGAGARGPDGQRGHLLIRQAERTAPCRLSAGGQATSLSCWKLARIQYEANIRPPTLGSASTVLGALQAAGSNGLSTAQPRLVCAGTRDSRLPSACPSAHPPSAGITWPQSGKVLEPWAKIRPPRVQQVPRAQYATATVIFKISQPDVNGFLVTGDIFGLGSGEGAALRHGFAGRTQCHPPDTSRPAEAPGTSGHK